MFFHLIVSSCISHNFNCPFLEPVTFATRATLAVLHLIVTLMSFYFVCYVYISRKLNFSFIWIFLLESWENLTVLSFDCFVCILRNFSCPLITLLHSNLSRTTFKSCRFYLTVAFVSFETTAVLPFDCYVCISCI